LLVWVDLYVPLCMQQHTKYEWATHLVCPSFFFKLRSSPKHSNKNLTELDLQIQTSLSWKHSDTHSYERTFFSQWPTLSSPAKILTFLPESLCISCDLCQFSQVASSGSHTSHECISLLRAQHILHF
jgi:hypothetical protein